YSNTRAMPLESYKNLIVWQKSIQLVKEMYIISDKMPKMETYILVSQMLRAVISIPSNIAEGYKRNYKKEYLQFLRIADASAAELETQIIIAKDRYANIDFGKAESLLLEVQKMLHALISKLSIP